MGQTKILVVASNPVNTKLLRLDEEAREIGESLRRGERGSSFTVESRWAARIRDLSRAMLDCRPQLIHFSGHGNPSGLSFEDHEGRAQTVKVAALSNLFKLFAGQIECAVLNACHTAPQAEAISEHVPYVIGMNKALPDGAAIKFAGGFYDALGAGRSYPDAYKFGCSALEAAGVEGHDTPVLYEGRVRSAPGGQTRPVLQALQPPLELFYSYAREDEGLRESLDKHLKIMQRTGLIQGWHDRKIAGSEEWEDEINQHLESAPIILLLVSANFLASDYAWDVEMKRAMERHERREARVIPIILSPCDWGAAPFAKLQALPKDAKPVTTWSNRDAAFLEVAKGIREVIERLTGVKGGSGVSR